MRIELLHIDECPNSAETQERLEAALRILGRCDIPVHVRQLSSASETTDTGFADSPTLAVDGNDIFPTGAVAPESPFSEVFCAMTSATSVSRVLRRCC